MRTRELIAQDGTETNYKELYNDEGKYMSTVSKKYKPVLHSKIITLAQNAVKQLDIDYTEKVMTLHNGRDLTYHMTMEGFGEKISPQLVIQNTYKAGKAMKLIQGQLTMVCSNGIISGDKHSTFTHTHVRHLDQELFSEYINVFLANHTKRVEYLTKLESIETSPYFLNAFFDEEKRIFSKTDADRILNMWETRRSQNVYPNRSGDNVSDFYNTVTEYFTHQSKISENGRLKRLSDIDVRIQELV